MLEIRGLRKTFGSLVAVNNVSFTIAPGQVGSCGHSSDSGENAP